MAKAKAKAKPEWQRLIERCQRLWAAYDSKPTKANLEKFGAHLEKMKVSKSMKVKAERTRGARAFRQQWKAAGYHMAAKKPAKRKATKKKAAKRRAPRKNPGYTVMLEHVDGRHKIGHGETVEQAEGIASKQLGRPVKVDFHSTELVSGDGGQLYFIEGPELTALQDSILYIEAGSGNWDPEDEMNIRYAPRDPRGEIDREEWLDAVRGLYYKGFALTRTGSLEEEKAWHADKDSSWWRFHGLTDAEIRYVTGWSDIVPNPKKRKATKKKATKRKANPRTRGTPSKIDLGVRPVRDGGYKWAQNYVVRGSGLFPVDMLRYDSSFVDPSDPIEGRDLRTVHLTRYVKTKRDQPTAGRWRSFGWEVLGVDDVKLSPPIKEVQTFKIRGAGPLTVSDIAPLHAWPRTGEDVSKMTLGWELDDGDLRTIELTIPISYGNYAHQSDMPGGWELLESGPAWPNPKAKAKRKPAKRKAATRKNPADFTDAEIVRILRGIGIGVKSIENWPRIADEIGVKQVVEIFTDDRSADRDSTDVNDVGLIIWERFNGEFSYLYAPPTVLFGMKSGWVKDGYGHLHGQGIDTLKGILHYAISMSGRGTFTDREMASWSPKQREIWEESKSWSNLKNPKAKAKRKPAKKKAAKRKTKARKNPMDRLTAKHRNEVNGDLIAGGFDGNGRFKSMGAATNKAWGILARHGIEQGQVVSADLFRGDSGHITLRMAFSNESDAFSPQEIQNSMLAWQWHWHTPEKLEVVAYAS